MLRHQYVDLFQDLFQVRDAKWKNEEKNMNVSALFLFLLLQNYITVLADTEEELKQSLDEVIELL